MARKPGITIGGLAKATGTQAETIRYYERIGLLPAPGRSSGNYRLYGAKDAERLAFVRRSRDLGFGIEDIRALLALAEKGDRDCGEVDAIARDHLADVERKITDLERLARELRRLIRQCHGGRISECRIIEALAPPGSHLLADSG
ncbi:MAG TPA: helix-turn-helix domain-containing protein [Stellaceae bacterium]|nr:helix-turn-helix domain-containing protein [Stellaceae bacterium]